MSATDVLITGEISVNGGSAATGMASLLVALFDGA
jgi:hypothetical protein